MHYKGKDPPHPIMVGDSPIKLTNQVKILGLTFTNRLSLNEHIINVANKANLRLWMLRRLKKEGVSPGDLLIVFKAQVRPIYEYNLGALYGLLTKENIEVLEKVQKLCLRIIFGSDMPYQEALGRAGLGRVDTRLLELHQNLHLNLIGVHWQGDGSNPIPIKFTIFGQLLHTR